jgi:O-methyltransferase involved in polyketide biosynthesis
MSGFARWFDLDLPEVIVRKLKLINQEPALPTENYFARSIDLRLDFASGLIGEKFDKNLPTFFVDEFSMIYIEQSLVAPVLRFASTLTHSTIISIGLSNMNDDFGRIWIEAFRDNNTPLKGIEDNKWESLFESLGFSSTECVTFEDEAQRIQDDEKSRIAQIEVQNKPEELDCLLRHYIVIRCIV